MRMGTTIGLLLCGALALTAATGCNKTNNVSDDDTYITQNT